MLTRAQRLLLVEVNKLPLKGDTLIGIPRCARASESG